MATRAELRDAFYTKLLECTQSYTVTDPDGSTVTIDLTDSDISLREPETDESLPGVVYHENYTRRYYNDVGSGPDQKRRDSNGDVIEEVWREYVEAQFIIDVRASNEVRKEPIYENIRSTFSKYDFDPWDKTDLHPHVVDIDVLDSTTTDSGDAEDVIRGDQLEVRITFYREYTLDEENIDTINTTVDGDNYTTT